jgi:uncharacterized protein YecE (DUF72 family)
VTIRVGVGGWTFEPWREVFYPPKLAQTKELTYAASMLTSIEINGTFYGSQKPESFAKWAAETPLDFVFSLKAPRFAVNRRVLADGGDSITRFFASGVDRLGDKLGPILWQFAATKVFDRDDFAAFLKLLPEKVGDRRLRHALEPRHESFADPAFAALAKEHNAAIVFADADKYPTIGDPATAPTADFVYARLQRTTEDHTTGFDDATLDHWAQTAKGWARAGADDVFVYVISGAKVRNPAAAMALIDRIG